MRLLLLALCLALAVTIPTEFDIRAQSTLLRYADYSLRTEGICSGYSWAKELAQILSNAYSHQLQSKVRISAQHILECAETNSSVCYRATKQNILDGMKFVSKKGAANDDCYPNKPVELAGSCRRVCHDGDEIDFTYFADFNRHTNVLDVFDLLKKNEKTVAFAIIKVDDTFNYFNSLSPVLSGNPTDVFEYRVAEVLGWKSKQEKVILRAGMGEGWGYGGFVDLDLAKNGKYIEEYYVVDISRYSGNIRTE